MDISQSDLLLKLVQSGLAEHMVIQTRYGEAGDSSETDYVSADYDAWLSLIPSSNRIYLITDLKFDAEVVPNTLRMSFRHSDISTFTVKLTSEIISNGLKFWTAVTKEPLEYRLENLTSSAQYLAFTWRGLSTDATRIEKITRLMSMDLEVLALMKNIDTNLAKLNRLTEIMLEKGMNIPKSVIQGATQPEEEAPC